MVHHKPNEDDTEELRITIISIILCKLRKEIAETLKKKPGTLMECYQTTGTTDRRTESMSFFVA
jgi:hypothetical protein